MTSEPGTTGESDTTPRACSPQAQELAARCAAQANDLARRISRGELGTLPGVRELPDDLVDVEVAATIRYGLRAFLRVVRGEVPPGSDPEALFRRRAAQRADEGMPLDLLIRTHLMARQGVWKALRAQARPGEEQALLELADTLFESQTAGIAVVTDAYLAETSAAAAGLRDRTRDALASLARGVPPDPEQAEELGLAAGGRVLVLPLDLPGDRVAAAVAARRIERALTGLLGRQLGRHPGRPAGPAAGPGAADPTRPPSPGPTGPNGPTGPVRITVAVEAGQAVALLTGTAAGPAGPGPARPDGEPGSRLAEAVAELTGRPTPIGAARFTGPPDVVAAIATARELVELAARLGRTGELLELGDVVLEYHLSRPGRGTEALGALRALLAPVLEQPELARTLRSYVELQQDRRATAELLGLHPNTVDNRIRRAGALMGADLTTPRGYALALAALSVVDVPGPPSR